MSGLRSATERDEAPLRKPPAEPSKLDATAIGADQARVLQLQSLAGNGAVRDLLAGPVHVQRDETSQDYHIGYEDGSQGQVSSPGPRNDEATADYEAGYKKGKSEYDKGNAGTSPPVTADDALAKANAAMDAAQLATLRTVATGHINLAYTAYVSACKDVKDSIRAAAKHDAEMMALILDVAMGFATPGLSKWIVGFANRIPVDSSNLTYRAAMAALDSDRVKAVLTGLTKSAGQMLKWNATALAGETEVDAFVGELETSTQTAFQAVIDELPGKNAVEVGIVAAAFDSSVANHDVYRADVKHLCDLYQQDVAPIGDVPFMGNGFPPEAVWVKNGILRNLAIVQYQPGFLGVWGNKYLLLNWVDPAMEQLALAKQGASRPVETIDHEDLREIH